MRYGACWIAFVLATVSSSVQADNFFLKDGSTVDGTVLRSIGKTLSIKLDDGGMYQLPIGAVNRIEMTAADGTLITGRLSRWDDGVFLLVTDQGLVEVKDGVISQVADSQTPIAEPELAQPDLGESVDAPAPSSQSLTEGQQLQKLEPTM